MVNLYEILYGIQNVFFFYGITPMVSRSENCFQMVSLRCDFSLVISHYHPTQGCKLTILWGYFMGI